MHKHRGRITDFEGIGATSQNEVLGFFSHNQLAVERETIQTLGWSYISLFNRPKINQPFVRSNSSLPITEKESNKWYEPSLYSRDEVLAEAEHCLYVMDREADIYEVISSLPNSKCDILVRAKHNRLIHDKTGAKVKLKNAINQSCIKAKVELEVNGESRKRSKRKAQCELRFEKFNVPRPCKKYKGDNFPSSIELTVVQIKEVSEVPAGENPIEWLLWTSESVKNKEDALNVIKCYSARWTIEEAHRLLKTKGFNIESSELESGKSIRKLLILGMEASIKIMALKASRSGETEAKTAELFKEKEISLLEILNQKLEGQTELQQNPYPKINLAWAAWIIARLGGWKGYKSQRPPGTITFKRGFDKFNQQYSGYLAAIEFKDVCKR